MWLLSYLLASLVFVGVVSAVPAAAGYGRGGLPVVDLGYVKHQAAEYNETAAVYVYRNIRFAAPPVGERRLKKPQPPLREGGIQNGDYGRSTSCAQTNGTALLGDEDCLVGFFCPCCVDGGGLLADVETVSGHLRPEGVLHEERKAARARLVSLCGSAGS